GPAVLEWNPPATREPIRPSEGLPASPSPRMRGKVVLVTTTVNSDWNNWPASPAFPAFANELLHFATSPRLREQSVVVGEPLELFLTSASAAAEGVLSLPDGRQENVRGVRQDDAGLLRWPDSDASGVYKMVVGQH